MCKCSALQVADNEHSKFLIAGKIEAEDELRPQPKPKPDTCQSH